MSDSVFSQLGQSRKFVVLALAFAALAIPLSLVAGMVFVGRASFDQFTKFCEWAMGSLATMVGTYHIAQGVEDAARNRSAPITAGGDVTVNRSLGAPEPPLVVVSPPPPPSPSSGKPDAPVVLMP